jgi:hypothetical protein
VFVVDEGRISELLSPVGDNEAVLGGDGSDGAVEVTGADIVDVVVVVVDDDDDNLDLEEDLGLELVRLENEKKLNKP